MHYRSRSLRQGQTKIQQSRFSHIQTSVPCGTLNYVIPAPNLLLQRTYQVVADAYDPFLSIKVRLTYK